jgi:hypothetical protein
MIVDFKDPAVDADDEEYGEVIDRPEGASKSHLTELKTEGRPRGSSFASSSSSLSPNMSPDSAIVSAAQVFPFSIHHPPPTDVLDWITTKVAARSSSIYIKYMHGCSRPASIYNTLKSSYLLGLPTPYPPDTLFHPTDASELCL